jgi:hypothetical protein
MDFNLNCFMLCRKPLYPCRLIPVKPVPVSVFCQKTCDLSEYGVYLSTTALILFIHVGFLEYLSFKQFKLIVKMTRIESGVTVSKGLFTLYGNVKIVTAKNFCPPLLCTKFMWQPCA